MLDRTGGRAGDHVVYVLLAVKLFERVNIPNPIAAVVRRRVRPLVRLYWLRQGSMSLDDLVFSAYAQAVHDCASLNQSGQMPATDEIKP